MPLSFLLFTSSQIHTTICVDWFTTGGKQQKKNKGKMRARLRMWKKSCIFAADLRIKE